jgi:hypothetical protein
MDHHRSSNDKSGYSLCPTRDEIDEEIDRLIATRRRLETAVVTVLREAIDVCKLEICGTDELPAALTALDGADYVDTEEDAARWVSRAFTARPQTLLAAGAGDAELALCGAVMMMRTALADLDTAKQPGDQPE